MEGYVTGMFKIIVNACGLEIKGLLIECLIGMLTMSSISPTTHTISAPTDKLMIKGIRLFITDAFQKLVAPCCIKSGSGSSFRCQFWVWGSKRDKQTHSGKEQSPRESDTLL